MSANDAIGYGKPPKKSRFKKGQSGNPKGRLKGSKNFKTIFEEVLRQLVVVRHGDGQKSVTLVQAMVMALMKRAMQSDKACELVVKLVDKFQLFSSTPSGVQADAHAPFAWTEDHESLRPFIEHLLNGDEPVTDEEA